MEFKFNFNLFFFKGSECTIYCALAPDLKPTKGMYFRNCKQTPLLEHATRKEDAQNLWNLTQFMFQQWIK